VERQEWVRVEVPASLLQVAVVAALVAARLSEQSSGQRFCVDDLFGFVRADVACLGIEFGSPNIGHHICGEHRQSYAGNTLGKQHTLA